MQARAPIGLLFVCLGLFQLASGNAPRVMEKMFDSTTVNFWWLTSNVVILMEPMGGTLRWYRSSTQGVTWEELQLTGDVSDDFAGWVFPCPSSPSKVLFFGTKSVWASDSAAQNLQRYPFEGRVRQVMFHPSNCASVLVLLHRSTPSGHVYKSLMFTADFGKNWSVMDPYVRDAMWHPQAGKAADVSPSSILVISYPSEEYANDEESITTTLYATSDYGRSKSELVKGALTLRATEEFIFTVQMEVRKGQLQSALLVAPTSDSDLAFVEAVGSNTPTGELGIAVTPANYRILDTGTGGVWLSLQEDEYGSRTSHLYHSFTGGLHYTREAWDLNHLEYWYPDFHVVKGLEGIYIANFASSADKDHDVFTMITFNNGGDWRFIFTRADSNIGCDGCRLHLHGRTSSVSRDRLFRYGPLYSTENAIGVIMATGNVGESLSDEKDEVKTFLSRDAGRSWEELKHINSSSIYEIGDHGGILVLADNDDPTDTVHYSLDEGLTWQQVHLPYEVSVENIRIEPSTTATTFLLHGTTRHKAVVVALDFREVQPRQCENMDYERWFPVADDNDPCFLGRVTEYKRRKRDAPCFNSEDLEHVVSVKNCECTSDDYECDDWYARGNDEQCTLYAPDKRVTAEQCMPGQYFYDSDGYVKIAGDTCVGGLTHERVWKMCPHNKSAHIPLIVALVLGGLLVFALVGAGIYHREKVTDAVSMLLSRNARPPAWREYQEVSTSLVDEDAAADEADNNML
eukprot:CAMPEP_0177678096 /NCGR_PEP_ID=MMETSP0447-20121125/28816_1 /TAXON_ID=0 /ORGANISM="Stygamoeba regulata, Strain BSH-02190019" /LENGTH=742 /DNA_ID=CAMNT_0019187055 /DNA_START=348 /DNA_END=2576 /DNA_ORIENTATION=-